MVDTSSWLQHIGLEDSTMRCRWCPLCYVDSYLCCLPTGIFFMDAAPFRQFLKSKVCATKADLSDAVRGDKGVEFCQWVLGLRDDYRGGKCIGEYIQQRDKRTVNKVPDLRYRVAE